MGVRRLSRSDLAPGKTGRANQSMLKTTFTLASTADWGM